ncbi:MAG: hypothetical protein FJY07_03965 [Bacteroidetes bacterium]|nr:hypothetical protein [Bacteroidota bacterium]
MNREKDKIDDLLRSTLSDFKQDPSLSVWNELSDKLNKTGTSKPAFKILKWIIPGIVLFLAVTLTWYYFKSPEQKHVLMTESHIQESETGKSNNESIKTNPAQNTLCNDFQQPASNSEAKGNIAESSSQNTDSSPWHSSVYPDFENTDFISNSAPGFSDDPAFPDVHRDIYLTEGYFPFLMKGTFYGLSSILNPLNEYPATVSIRQEMNGHLINNKYIKPGDDYGKKGNWCYGISLVPEIILHGNEKSQFGYATELTGRHTMDIFSIEGGFGVNFSEDQGRFKIDYEQYDSIAYYFKVTSFTLDEETGKPIFNTTVETVFDTVDYTASETTRNSYIYLYFPLYAGVEVSRFHRFSIHVNAGAIYSVLIDKNEPQSAYRNDRATSLVVINETPSRISSQVLVSGSLGIHYHFGNNIFLNVEPIIKYPVKPMYEKRYYPGTTWTTGLRAGLFFKF